MKILKRFSQIIASTFLITSLSYFFLSCMLTNENDGARGFAVIELFTSEGCSSCPPADELTAKISREYKDNLYVLGFHVDYWDRYGWKDSFSNADYSKRQYHYGQIFHLNS